MSNFMTTDDMIAADNSSSNSVNNNINSYVDNSAAWNTASIIDTANLINQLNTKSDIIANQSTANSINSVNANIAAGPNGTSVDSSQLIADLYPNTQTGLQKSVSDTILQTAYSQAELQRQLGNSGGVSSSATNPGGVYGGEDTQNGISLQDQTDQILNNSNSNLSGDSFRDLPDSKIITNSPDLISSIIPSYNTQIASNNTGIASLNNGKTILSDANNTGILPNTGSVANTASTKDSSESLVRQILNGYSTLYNTETPYTPNFSQLSQLISADIPGFTQQLPYAPSSFGIPESTSFNAPQSNYQLQEAPSATDRTLSGIMGLKNSESAASTSENANNPALFTSLTGLPADQTLARGLLSGETYNPYALAVQQAIANYSPEADLISAGGAEAKGRYTGAYPGAPEGSISVKQKEYSQGVNDLADSVFQVESKNIADAKNPSSSATGIGQFVSGTWLEQISKNYPELGTLKNGKFTPAEGYTKQDILDMRKDPTLSADLTKSYLTQIGKELKTDDPGTMYLGYFLGTGGA